MKINIVTPEIKHKEKVSAFLRMVITDTFEKNRIIDYFSEDLVSEITTQITFLHNCIDGQDINNFYLIAQSANSVIGVIGCSIPNQLIQSKVVVNPNYLEVRNVYVDPRYQNKGIGRLLFNKMIKELVYKGKEGFYLDCGYRNAQPFWEHILGKPTILLKNYWGTNSDHMIWEIPIGNILNKK